MSKTRTIFNKNHPITIYNQHIQDVKKVVRKLTKKELPEHAANIGVDPTGMHRGSLLRAILAKVATDFKKQWKERYGWDLEDARDQEKLKGHIQNAKIAHQKKIEEALAKDFMWFVDLLKGKKKSELSKEELDKMELDMRKVALSVYQKNNSNAIPNKERLWRLITDLQGAVAKKKEQEEGKDEAPDKIIGHSKDLLIVDGELPELSSTAKHVSWQKALSLLGKEGYDHAKKLGGFVVNSHDTLLFINKKWHLQKTKT